QLNEVEKQIRQELLQTHAREKAQARAKEDQVKVQNGAALAEVAQAASLTVVETPLLAHDETIPEVGAQPQLIEAALGLELKKISEPIAVTDSWYLVSPIEKVASTIPEFSSMKDEAEKRRKGEKAEQLAKEKAESFLTKVKEKKDLAAVAQ